MFKASLAASFCFFASISVLADESVYIVGVPDYSWYAGCFGTASGNLMGYWDRNGFPNFYTGPTGGGLAPLNSNGANKGIRSLWASKAGFDGRPADQPGHTDDYWEWFVDEGIYSYESAAIDSYLLAQRPEHAPDCTCDFMGASQNKWADLDGECSGNIDAFAFNFWDKEGNRRVNFTPPDENGIPVRDIQSGLRNWAKSRGTEAEVFSQLADFNPNVPQGAGFTFEDLKAEINAGYPVMLFLQNPDQFSRQVPGLDNANPLVHAMIAYGYVEIEPDVQSVRYRTSWASGDQSYAPWNTGQWEAQLALRGVIGFHPLPQITSVSRTEGGLRVKWDGPSSILLDETTGNTTAAHWYIIEKSDSLHPAEFFPISNPTTARETIVPDCCDAQAFFRVKLLSRSEIPQ